MTGEHSLPSQKNESLSPSPASKRGGRLRVVLFVACLILLIIIVRALGLGSRLVELRDWIHDLGTLGYFIFAALYIAAVVATVPGIALTVIAGVLFGTVTGIILVSIGSTVGAALAFLVGRYIARGAIENWLGSNERFHRLDQLTEDHGAMIVALTRLVPLFPFNLLNYGYGLTRIRFWTYAFWTWLCMLPWTVVYIVGIEAFIEGLARGTVPWPLIALFAVLAVILFFLVRFASRKLREKNP